jgi:hypothetical protein
MVNRLLIVVVIGPKSTAEPPSPVRAPTHRPH